MTNEQKLEAAKSWMQSQGITIKKWKGPANPLPNLANKQPTIACYDTGLIGQWRAVLRMLTQ